MKKEEILELAEHPRPWRIQIVGVCADVIDALGDTVTSFDEDDPLWPFIVQMVNVTTPPAGGDPVGYGYSAEIQSSQKDHFVVSRKKIAIYDTALYATPQAQEPAWRPTVEQLEDILCEAFGRLDDDQKVHNGYVMTGAQAVHAALSTPTVQAPEGVESKWQPIETAPKDGTQILVWPYWSGRSATQVYWRDLQRKSGRWEITPSHYCAGANPTHWQPLPAAPSQEVQR